MSLPLSLNLPIGCFHVVGDRAYVMADGQRTCVGKVQSPESLARDDALTGGNWWRVPGQAGRGGDVSRPCR